MISKPSNAHNCMKVHYTHCIRPMSFGRSHGHLQGSALQKIATSKYYVKFLNRSKNIFIKFKK